MTDMRSWKDMPDPKPLTEAEAYQDLLDHARETYMDLRQRGLSTDAAGIIAEMIEDLDEGEGVKPQLVKSVTKAVHEFLAP